MFGQEDIVQLLFPQEDVLTVGEHRVADGFLLLIGGSFRCVFQKFTARNDFRRRGDDILRRSEDFDFNGGRP